MQEKSRPRALHPHQQKRQRRQREKKRRANNAKHRPILRARAEKEKRRSFPRGNIASGVRDY
jgi:hypothetical protein